MAFGIRKLFPVSNINGQSITSRVTGVRVRTNGFGFSINDNIARATTVQKSTAETEVITGVPTPVPRPTGTTDPGTTNAAAVAVSDAAKKDYDLAVLRLKNFTGQITSYQEVITRIQATMPKDPSPFIGLIVKVKKGQIKSIETQIEALKVKVKEQELEIERLKSLL